MVNEGVAQKWSPQQITRRLTRDYPDDEVMRVSPDTIYETLFVQARGDCRTQLTLALRSRADQARSGRLHPAEAGPDRRDGADQRPTGRGRRPGACPVTGSPTSFSVPALPHTF